MTAALLEVTDLKMQYAVRRGGPFFGRTTTLRAVDGVSFRLEPGRTLGIVGESGCGKSTTAGLVLGLIPATSGTVRFDGQDMPAPDTPAWRALRRRLQMVFQDPLGALDRRLTVGRQIAEPLTIHQDGNRRDHAERVREIAASVGLQASQLDRYPHELSGGQRQRVVLARALILEPSLLVCDEPVSALDVSIQAQVVNLLLDLQARLGIAYVFISHDLKVVRQVSHDVAVMYLGRIVEHGDPDLLFMTPAHPYTAALVSAIPTARARRSRPRVILSGDPPDPMTAVAGCAFHPRCPAAIARCRTESPALRALPDGRRVACHLAEPGILKTGIAHAVE
ncbi:MAG TPA: oligopeptide/dipeptide ABC transporter ATP-binding protein [Stellaceae bacterium]|nr:oligopeptide/dipeptide ABC transporter ATP-binding protein [Stellaceae bacterium]